MENENCYILLYFKILRFSNYNDICELIIYINYINIKVKYNIYFILIYSS